MTFRPWLLAALLALPAYAADSGATNEKTLEASLDELAVLLSQENPCPTGEAGETPEWKACVERWERLKTEELYLPYQSAKAAREISSEGPPAEAEDGHQN